MVDHPDWRRLPEALRNERVSGPTTRTPGRGRNDTDRKMYVIDAEYVYNFNGAAYRGVHGVDADALMFAVRSTKRPPPVRCWSHAFGNRKRRESREYVKSR